MFERPDDVLPKSMIGVVPTIRLEEIGDILKIAVAAVRPARRRELADIDAGAILELELAHGLDRVADVVLVPVLRLAGVLAEVAGEALAVLVQLRLRRRIGMVEVLVLLLAYALVSEAHRLIDMY